MAESSSGVARTVRRWAVVEALLLLALVLWFGSGWLADSKDQEFNPTLAPGPATVTERAAEVHGAAKVIDLHADSLLWRRDLLEDQGWGHVNLPKLVQGGVALQVFSMVTKVPRGQNFRANRGDSDRLIPLMMANHWPPTTWFDPLGRARHQARRLEEFVERSQGRLLAIRDRSDLETLADRRSQGDPVVGALLAIEGLHGLADDPEASREQLRELHRLGLRMLAPVHFFDNTLGGSAHGVDQGGLTDLGRRIVEEAEALGMVIDLAHASGPTFYDALVDARHPRVVSHAGVRGTCDSSRNLSDDQLRLLARNGGVLGIAFFDEAVCGDDVGAILDAIDHAVAVAGIDHVGLGSDFDGTVTTPIDAAGLPILTEGLLDRGYSEDEIAKILGGNAWRILNQVLPGPEGP